MSNNNQNKANAEQEKINKLIAAAERHQRPVGTWINL